MSLKKILCFVFTLYSLFIFADGTENPDLQSPPVTETENQNLPETENADTTVPSGTETENKNLSENEKEPEESLNGVKSLI